MSVSATGHDPHPTAPAMSDGESRRAGGKEVTWILQVTSLSLSLGIMLALAIRTQEKIRTLGLPSNRHGVSAATLSRYSEQNELLEGEITGLKDDLREMDNEKSTKEDNDKAFQKVTAELRALTGYAPVEGPGLRLTLRDSPRPVQPGSSPSDYWVIPDDLNGLIFELRAAGAEAFSISELGGKNAQRFVFNTTVQPSGRDMLINGVVLKAPYVLQAIGNPKELRAALEMPDGIVDNRGLGNDVLQMLTIEEAKHLVLPAYVPSRGPSSAATLDE